LSGVELEVDSLDGAPGISMPSAFFPGEGEVVEPFEMEMLRTEKEQFQAEVRFSSTITWGVMLSAVLDNIYLAINDLT